MNNYDSLSASYRIFPCVWLCEESYVSRSRVVFEKDKPIICCIWDLLVEANGTFEETLVSNVFRSEKQKSANQTISLEMNKLQICFVRFQSPSLGKIFLLE